MKNKARRLTTFAGVAILAAVLAQNCGGSNPSPTPPSSPSLTPTPTPTASPTPTPPPSGGTSCGVERWPVKTLSDANATRVNFSAISATIASLNTFAAHCSGLPDARTFAEEFRVYEITGVVQLTRNEDDRDVHIVLSDPSDSTQTVVVEVADPVCDGVMQSIDFSTLMQARAMYQALGSFTGKTVKVRGVGFYDFDHGQTGRSRSCIELHPVISITLASGSDPTATFGTPFTHFRRRLP